MMEMQGPGSDVKRQFKVGPDTDKAEKIRLHFTYFYFTSYFPAVYEYKQW